MKNIRYAFLVWITVAVAPADAGEQAGLDNLRSSLEALMQHPDVSALRSDPAAFARRIAELRTAPFVHYDADELQFMLLGLSVKGSGGGGGLVDGADIWMKLDQQQGIDIYDVGTAKENQLYMVVGGLGAPSALKQHLDGLIEAIEKSMRKLSDLKKLPIGGILSVESGPVNSMLAILLSQELGVPLIDVDGAGRSVPSLTNLTYAYETYPVAPVVAASALDPGQDVLVYNPKDAEDAEVKLREAATKLGGLIGIALWGQTGEELQQSQVIQDAFLEAYALGLFTAVAAGDPAFIDEYFKLGNDYIGSWSGRLTRFKIDSSGGFDQIYVDVTLPDGAVYTVNAVNEDLLMEQAAPQQGVTVTAPHIIGYLVRPVGWDAWLPFNNGDVDVLQAAAAAQQPIHVIAAQAAPRLYDFEQSFLAILHQVYGYQGPVVPPHHPQESASLP